MSDGGARWAQLLALSARQLAEAGVPSPEHDARELAEAVSGKSASVLVMDAGAVSVEQAREYEELVCRRAEREPLQHILGTMYFRYLQLESRPGVFIVRPETEMVAQAGIDFLTSTIRSANSSFTAGKAGRGRVDIPESMLQPVSAADQLSNKQTLLSEPFIAVDLFSGSGAIALALATEVTALAAPPPSPPYASSSGKASPCPKLQVYGVELSPTAYESAQRNNDRYGNPVRFIHADALDALPEPYEQQIAGKTTLVIANPPYVPAYHELSLEVQADPSEALFGGGSDGLDIPLRTIIRAWNLLAPGGLFIMEHASEQSAALRDAAQHAGFTQVSTGRDLTGAERWLHAQKPAHSQES